MVRLILVSDFRGMGTPPRFSRLASTGGVPVLELEPPAQPAATLPDYVQAMVDNALGGSEPAEVALVTNCAAFTLAGEISLCLHERGTFVTRVIAIGPQPGTAAGLREAYQMVVDQLGTPISDPEVDRLLAASDGRLRQELGEVARRLAELIVPAVVEQLDGDEEVAYELAGRYEVWLRHALACRAAAPAAVDVPVRAVVFGDVDLASAGFPELVATAHRCSGDPLACDCVSCLVRGEALPASCCGTTNKPKATPRRRR
jgi:hypothetical protein